MSKFNLGDIYIVDGIEGEIKYMNAGYMCLFPTPNLEPDVFFRGRHLLLGVCFAVMDEKCHLVGGDTGKAYPLNKTDCGAV